MSRLSALLLLLPAIACSDEPAAPAVSVPLAPEFTAGSGVTGERLAQATFDIRKVKRINKEYDWHVELKAKPALDIAVRRFTYAPGSQTGWHTHPGPSLIVITSGLVTAYEGDDPDCTPHVYGPGTSLGNTFIDPGGDHVHVIRNETSSEARGYAVQLIPPLGPGGRRINVPHPLNCPLTID